MLPIVQDVDRRSIVIESSIAFFTLATNYNVCFVLYFCVAYEVD